MKSWTETYYPRFGQISLWVLLATSSYLVLETHLQYQHLPKGDNLSVLGYIFPVSFWDNPVILPAGKAAFFISALIWAALPFACKLKGYEKQLPELIKCCAWLCVASYFFVACTYWENLPWVRHKFVLPFWLLSVNALWYQFYANQIVQAFREGDYYKKELYPGWVYGASVFLIAMFYSFSGLSKLLSTPNWADGTSLQLWTFAFGDQNSPVAKLILADRFNAKILQSGVLSLECLSALAIISGPLRVLIGIGLALFHCAVDLTFSIKIPFESQKILLLLYFLPWFRTNKKQNTSD